MRGGMLARGAAVIFLGRFYSLSRFPVADFLQRPTVNPGALILQDFEHRIADYMKLRKDIKGRPSPPKPKASPANIARYQHQLEHPILEARSFGNYRG